MSKNIIQDVVPKDGSRYIRDIHITHGRTRKASSISHNIEDDFKKRVQEVREEFEPEPLEHRPHRPITWNPKKWIIIGCSISAVVLGFFITNLFHSAKITVSPEIFTAILNTNLLAKQTAGVEDLQFEVVTVAHDASVVVKSTGEQQVDKRASGTIVIYNNYNASAQRLIKNTRFVTPEGLVFRIDQSVTVPGKTGSTPGKIEVIVYADEVGEKYNEGLKDFVIPGFKGDPRYTAFYARSKPGAPLEGGFSGIMKVVSDADRKSAQESLQKELSEELLKDIIAKVPKGKLFYKNMYRIDWTPLVQENLDANQVRIKETGTLSLAIFDDKDLATHLARVYVPGYKNENIMIEDIDKLVITPKSTSFNPSSDKSITLTISGDAKFVWLFDEVALKQSLLGKSRSQFYDILKDYAMITKADVSISPFWKGSFPDKIDKIVIDKKI